MIEKMEMPGSSILGTIQGEQMVKIKKKFIVIGVIVALILAAIIYTVIWSSDDSISRLFLGTIVDNDDSTGIIVRAVADPNGPGSVEGKGRIKILYEDTEVYSKSLSFSADQALKEIPYKDFVMGNGDYEVEVAYKDKKVTEVHTIEWVLEYIHVGTSYDEFREQDRNNLKIVMFPLGGDLTSEFTMAKSFKTDLDASLISDGLISEFEKNKFTFAEGITPSLIKANQKEWIFSSVVKTLLIREEAGGLQVYSFASPNAKPIGVDIDLTVYREGSKVHEKTVQKSDAPFLSIDYGGYEYEVAGDYRFEVKARNSLIKDDSPFVDSISSVLTEKLNQKPNANLSGGFSYDKEFDRYEKTVYFKLSEVGAEYTIDFDASGSYNDGPLTYEWDWDYFDPMTSEEEEEFNVDETGAVVSHGFYPEASGSDEYVGLRLIGDVEVDMDGDGVVEKEYSIVLIHIQFKLKI